MNIRNISFALITVSFISACGGGGSTTPPITQNPQTTPEPSPEPTPEPEVLTGIFIDSAVQGLNYSTQTQSGTTDEEGTFSYIQGEKVRFSIGDVSFPETNAKATLSPLDVFGVTDVADLRVINMARLLQTLDSDGVAGNGITITDDAHNQATGVSVDFASADFDSQVMDIVANSGAVYTSLINAQSATEHLNLTLGNMQNTRSCDVETNKIGYTGTFSNFAHDVSGMAKVIDGCTIEITMFNFDGQAPNVRFYSGNNLNFSGDKALALSDRIDGRAYKDETIVLRLPNTLSMDDFDSISVWCVEFTVDFGSLVLAAP
ncbi:DM13 domain-containing protein [Paraglaciecola sp.]|uniref:DM13 domain-containing protein n=1 Tax=Paraglaciecola sp. TaxID=1920173 RepID=UPI003EF30DD8